MSVSRLSKTLLPTLKSSHQILSSGSTGHDLLLRGGFIRQSSSGIFSFLPFGLKVLENLESLIDDEMKRIDGQKISLPLLLSSNGWKQTGRWTTGGEMFKLKDRKDSDFCLAPTHEEEITQLVASQVSSYRQLPLRLYQIGKKYRDELRPRAGLLRGREFIMKDLYTFDATEEEAIKTYEQVRASYTRILDRIGTPYASALADSGNIGGSKSHEYHLLSEVGEDIVLKCKICGYAANEERAQALVPLETPRPMIRSLTLEDLMMQKDLSFELGCIRKDSTDRLVLVVTMKGWKSNPIKINQHPSVKSTGAVYKPFPSMSLECIHDKLKYSVEEPLLLLDETVVFNTGSPDFFVVGIQGDFKTAREGDLCPNCYSKNSSVSPLSSHKAIEIGHTFYLGTKYSEPLGAIFKDKTGTSYPIQMGCFGLGVSRMIAAIVETCHDKDGIIWPPILAPAQVCLISGEAREATEALSTTLSQVVGNYPQSWRPSNSIVLDDRDHPIGFKIKDSLLVGYPYLLVLGRTFQETRKVELVQRRTGDRVFIALKDFEEYLDQLKPDKESTLVLESLFHYFHDRAQE